MMFCVYKSEKAILCRSDTWRSRGEDLYQWYLLSSMLVSEVFGTLIFLAASQGGTFSPSPSVRSPLSAWGERREAAGLQVCRGELQVAFL